MKIYIAPLIKSRNVTDDKVENIEEQVCNKNKNLNYGFKEKLKKDAYSYYLNEDIRKCKNKYEDGVNRK